MRGFLKVILGNRKALVGLTIVGVIVLAAFLAPLLSQFEPLKRLGRPHEAPNLVHLLGTTRMGQDVWSQLLYGSRTSLAVGFATGILITAIGTLIGLVAGYFGGRIDAVLNTLTNVVLVIPNLPLLLVLSAFIGQAGPVVITLIIASTSWAWGARVTRAQTMSLREKDFIRVAEIGAEPTWRILLAEILPNLISIVTINLIGSITYAVMTEATLEFLGLGDPQSVSWGMMLHNAQNASALTVGAWWEVLAPCAALGLLGAGLSLINFAVDEVSNPRLRSGAVRRRWLMRLKLAEARP